MYPRVGACVRDCVRARVCVLVFVWVLRRVGLCMCLRACNFAYLAYNEHVPYCYCRVSGSAIFFGVINGTIFGKEVPEYKMCVLICSIHFT